MQDPEHPGMRAVHRNATDSRLVLIGLGLMVAAILLGIIVL